MESDSEPLMHYGAVAAPKTAHRYEKEEQPRYNASKIFAIVAIAISLCGALIAIATNNGLASFSMDYLSLRAGGVAIKPVTEVVDTPAPTSSPTYYMTMLYVIQVRNSSFKVLISRV
jgi:hypothetical protein